MTTPMFNPSGPVAAAAEQVKVNEKKWSAPLVRIKLESFWL
jgi:hypothetical protein